jgi:amino acid transporter
MKRNLADDRDQGRSDAVPAAPAMPRAIGRWDLTAAIVNGVIGSAIFGLPSALAALTGAWSPLAALVAAAGVLLIVLCFAEVASRFDRHGGVYLYAREAFGPLVGFEVGWLMLCTRVLSAAATLNLFATYLATLVPDAGGAPGRVLTIVAVVAVVTTINLLGVRQATWAVNAFTLAKLAPLLLLIAIGLPQVDAGVLATQTVAAPDWTQAVLLLMFAFGGFETALIPAGEQRDPRRDAGVALLTALAAIAAIYLLVQLVVVGVLPQARASEAPIAAVFERLLGTPGLLLASLGALISIWGYNTGVVLQAPRMLHAMAERGELPRALAHVHRRWLTPDVAIVLFAAAVLAFALAGSFAANATLSAIVRLIYYALTCAALPVLRRRGGAPAGFRLPLAIAIVPLAIGFCAWLLSTRTFEQAWVLAALIAAGLGLYALSRRQAKANEIGRPS